MLLYKYLCDSFPCLRAQTGDGASGRKVDYVNILRLKGNPDLIFYSKVKAILLNGWILPISGVAAGRVCSRQA